MSPFTKSERKELREIAGEAYEWELHRHLSELDRSFAQWRRGEMLSSELSAAIHEFHQHAARELWSMYQSLGEVEIVARGLAIGAVALDRLSPQLKAKIQPLSGHWRQHRGDAA